MHDHCPFLKAQPFPAVSYNKTMIIVTVEDFNNFSQDYYNSVIDNLQFHQLKCTCNQSGCLFIHAYYNRGVYTPYGIVYIRICRVRCEACGRTHALLLSSLVPYDRIPFCYQHQIVCAYEDGTDPNAVCECNNFVDENSVKAVVRRYRSFWQQRLLSEFISLDDAVSLSRECLDLYSRQFMQIHATVAIPFFNTT